MGIKKRKCPKCGRTAKWIGKVFSSEENGADIADIWWCKDCFENFETPIHMSVVAA